jgi:hypothetical protein
VLSKVAFGYNGMTQSLLIAAITNEAANYSAYGLAAFTICSRSPTAANQAAISAGDKPGRLYAELGGAGFATRPPRFLFRVCLTLNRSGQHQHTTFLIQVCHEAYLGLNPCCFGCRVLSWPRHIRQRRAHRKQDDVQDKRQILADFRKRSGNPAKR